jgi:hypothetical protein
MLPLVHFDRLMTSGTHLVFDDFDDRSAVEIGIEVENEPVPRGDVGNKRKDGVDKPALTNCGRVVGLCRPAGVEMACG